MESKFQISLARVMPNVVEEIPIELKPAAEAALAWINQERGAQFKLTGLVDPDKAMGQETGQPIELGLVLCEGDLCRREQVRVEAKGQGFEVSAIEAETSVIPPQDIATDAVSWNSVSSARCAGYFARTRLIKSVSTGTGPY